MTSKEALELLYKNLSCEHCKRYEECIGLKEYETFCNYAHYKIKQDLERLEMLEDLEKKLGVSIIKVFEALENGAWVKSKEWGLCKWNMPNIFNEYDSRYEPKSNPELQFLKSGKYEYFKLKDYGKTWALTKEELDENEL